MASDNQANYSKIGFFLVAGVALIVGTLVYIGGAGSVQHEFPAETYFSDSVSGLSVGSAVNLRGVRVGSVKRISFVGSEYGDLSRPEDGRRIYVLLTFDTRLFRLGETRRPEQVLQGMVDHGLHATVSASGVTGLSHIELHFPKREIEVEKIGWRPRHVYIPPAPSILQSAADSAQQILNQLNKMDFVAAWSNVLEVTSNASSALENLNATLSAEQGGISEIVDNVRQASSSLRDFVDQVSGNPSSLLRSYSRERLEETK